MKKTLRDLVNNLYTDKQREDVKEIIAHSSGHLMNYQILAVGIEDSGLSKEEVVDFYGADKDEAEWLTPVDFVIVNLITSLSKLTGKDIKTGYLNAITLDKNEPEFEYLVNEVREYLSKWWVLFHEKGKDY